MAQEETVTVRYLVLCGKPTPEGFMEDFQYSEQAPASLCKPRFDNEPHPDPDATGVFIASLVERHHEEILHSRAWQCVTMRQACERAPPLCHNAAPICISGGACDRGAEKMVHEFAKTTLVKEPSQFEPSKTCDKCGKKSGVKLCGGCKVVAFCSKECQAQRWPFHKKQCRLAQEAIDEDS